jgi:hypothetical protein
MTVLQAWALGTEAAGALLLVFEHYWILHGWGDRFFAWCYGGLAPEPTAHAHWERTWDRRSALAVHGLGLATLLMAAGLWSYSVNAGLAFAGAAELAASFATERARRRAARAEGQARDRL